jgi:hypothetical protein
VTIDYSVVGQIGAGLVLLVAGALLNRFLERRARVVVFYGHIGVFQLQQPPALQAPNQPPPQPPPPQFVNTHVVVIRNAGWAAAQNVHITHHQRLGANNIHVSVLPAITHSVIPMPNNTEEILIPTLPAKFQVTVSYLYAPPVTYNVINAAIYSDEGQARVITVLPQVQLKKWLLVILWILLAIGVVSVCYLLYELGRWAVQHV